MIVLLPLLAVISGAYADDYNHRYKERERVDLWVNKVRQVCSFFLHTLK
jgi:hypothetical protein